MPRPTKLAQSFGSTIMGVRLSMMIWVIMVSAGSFPLQPLPISGAPQLPCYFNTSAKAGVDFPAGPTGSFTNGETVAGIIAGERQGLDDYIPPFTTVKAASSATLAPCYFSFGDSLVDNGNNNNLVTRQKVNYPPYGIDFPQGSTGRFGNGLNIADFIAQNLGFNDFIPPYANTSNRDIRQGVNYGSGACGIRDETGKAEGDCISFNRQLGNHGSVVARIRLLMEGNLTKTREHLRQCLYTVVIGSNDYLNNYFAKSPLYILNNTSLTPDQYADALIQQYSRQLRILYNYGARKIAIFSLTKLGGALAVVNKPKNDSDYVDPQTINDAAESFNSRLKPMVDNLNKILPDANLILINSTSIGRGNPSLEGVRVTDQACCSQLVPRLGLCVPNSIPCNNRSEYLFFDNYHITQDLIAGLVRRAFNANLSTDAYPTDIATLIRSSNILNTVNTRKDDLMAT